MYLALGVFMLVFTISLTSPLILVHIVYKVKSSKTIRRDARTQELRHNMIWIPHRYNVEGCEETAKLRKCANCQ
jgi:hypothetical protein